MEKLAGMTAEPDPEVRAQGGLSLLALCMGRSRRWKNMRPVSLE